MGFIEVEQITATLSASCSKVLRFAILVFFAIVQGQHIHFGFFEYAEPAGPLSVTDISLVNQT